MRWQRADVVTRGHGVATRAFENRALDVQGWMGNADDLAWDPCVSTATNPFDMP